LEILSVFNLQHPRALRYCPPYAIAPAAGPGAALLRCLPPPVPAQRRCAPTRCRPTFNVQRSTFNPSRFAPRASEWYTTTYLCDD